MQAQEEREINDLTVVTRQLPPMRAYRLLARLGKFAGPIARALTPASLVKIKAGDYAAAIPVALSVFIDLKDDDAEELALDILRGSFAKMTVGGKTKLVSLETTDNVNAAFEGNLKAMLGAMMFALEVNYKDFFAGRGTPPPPDASPTETPSP